MRKVAEIFSLLSIIKARLGTFIDKRSPATPIRLEEITQKATCECIFW